VAVPPKPTERRQRRNKRNEVGSVVKLKREVVAPAPSSAWQKRTIAEWAAYWEDDISALVKPGEVSAVRRLFDYRDEHTRALRAYRKQRLTPGSTGQQRLAPAFDAMQKLEKMMVPLEDRFALSSMARLRLGVEFGSASKSLAEMNAVLEAEVDDDDNNESEDIVIELPGLPNSG
jgi:hypothetical protein